MPKLFEPSLRKDGDNLFHRALINHETARVILENPVLLELTITQDPRIAAQRLTELALSHPQTAKLICTTPLLLRHLNENQVVAIAEKHPIIPREETIAYLLDITVVHVRFRSREGS